MKVVCTAGFQNGIWYNRIKIFGIKLWKRYVKGPKKDDVVTIVKEKWIEGERYFGLMEWPDEIYEAIHFAPLHESTTEYSEVTFTEIKKETPVPSEN